MFSVIDNTRTIESVQPAAIEETDDSDALRIARYCQIEELPGLVFGAMTVVYIVLSLAGLAP